MIECPDCDGNGVEYATVSDICPECDGNGEIECESCDGGGVAPDDEDNLETLDPDNLTGRRNV